MIGSLGGPMLASMFAPDGQQLQSFSGHGALDPVNMLDMANTLIGRVGRGVTDRAATPISLPSAYVQQPGAYTGGGLPFPVGLVASDPALANPSLLNLPGMGEFQNLFAGFDPLGEGAPGENGNVDPLTGYTAPPGLQTDRRAVPKNGTGIPSSGDDGGSGTAQPLTAGPRRPGLGLRAADILDDGASGLGTKSVVGDDLDQAHGAASLLLEALSGEDQSFLDELMGGGRLAQPRQSSGVPSHAYLG